MKHGPSHERSSTAPLQQQAGAPPQARTRPEALPSIASLEARLRMQPEPPAAQDEATVTVVIPCYNYGRFLPASMASALSQTGVTVDVIVVDDCSTDDSAAIASTLAKRDPRVRLLRNRVNRGPVDTFNNGLAEAKGEFLVRLDADDMLTPGSLRRAVDVMRRFPSVGLVYGYPVHFEGTVPPEARTTPTQWTVWPGSQWVEARCRSGFNVVTSPEVLMRASVVDVVGGQEPLPHTHDMEMWFRMAAFCDVAYISGCDQAFHRDHSASLSAREVDSMRDLLGRRDAFTVLFDGIAAQTIDADRLRALVRRVLASEALDFACHQYDRGRANEATIDALETFAVEQVGDVTLLPEWRGLQLRRALGKAAKYNPWFVGQAFLRSRRGRERYRHWQQWGVYED